MGSDAGRRARGLPQLRPRTAATWWCASSSNTSPRSGNRSRPAPQRSARTIRLRRMSPPTGSPSASSAATVDGHLLCPGGRAAAGSGRLAAERLSASCDDDPRRPRLPARLACAPGQSARRPAPRTRRRRRPCSTPRTTTASCGAAANSGPRSTIRYSDDGKERGLLFMCLNTDIARQFEFVQQTWLLNRNFATLFDETDPLVGPEGRVHHPRTAIAPDRRRRDLHPDGRRRILLPAEPSGAEISGAAMNA